MASVTHTFVSGIADDPKAAAAGEVLPSHWNATHTISGIRDLLAANRTYYVSTTGSDSNDGLTPATAWATPQHAVDTLPVTIDGGGFFLTVQFGNGTYQGPNITSLAPNTAGFILVGDLNNQNNVTFDDTGPAGIADGCCLEYNPAAPGGTEICSIRFAPTGGAPFANDGIEIDLGTGVLTIVNCAFAGPAGGNAYCIIDFNDLYHIFVGIDLFNVMGGGIIQNGTTTISGDWAGFFWEDDYNCVVFIVNSIVFSGSVTMSDVFARVEFSDSNMEIPTGNGHCTFTGSFTGKRFSVKHFCHLITKEATSFRSIPGSLDGTLENGATIDSYSGDITAAPLTVAGLPPVSMFPTGARAFVTDSNSSLSAGLGSVVVASTSTSTSSAVPVYTDGTNWRIG